MVESLDRLTASWGNTLQAGAFKNALEPDRPITIADIEPADFTGYAGLQLVQNWTAAVLIGDHATTQADTITWTMTGLAVTNWIFGFYVVNTGGVLLWAQRAANAPIGMVNTGNVARFSPQFSLGSKFPA